MGRVSRVVAVLAAVGMLFSGGGMASAAESTGPAPGGASQCVPDRSTIAQCFPDNALAQGVAEQVKGDKGRTGEVLTSKDVKDTTYLDLSTTGYSGYSGISSVQGLQVFTNLTSLGLDGTRVSDVSPLSKLVNLKWLSLWKTRVSDVSPLSKLTKLEWLVLDGTGVSDVSPLSKLVKLWDLDLTNTRVSDVSPLSKLTKLEDLKLNGTRVLDLSPLSKLPLVWYWLGQNNGSRAHNVSPSVNLTANGDGSVSLPAPRWTDGSFVAPRSTSPAGGVLDAKRGVVTWKGYDAKASYSYDFAGGIADCGDPFSGHVTGVKPQARMVFRDVSSSTPHASDIAWLADTGVSTGWLESDGSYSFRGMDSVKRQDMAAFLRREAKRLGVKDAASWKPSDKDWKQFRDVTRDTPHAEDVLWLAHANVSTGWPEPDGSRTFRGMDPVRRQDMAAFLYRLAVKAGRGGGVRPGSFRDVSDATPHASEVRWLGGSGVSTGYADGTFRGMLPVYRQDMAAFLHRFDGLK
ncbi:S-layer homology domain-containing protein [Bifidobacterium boum]|uniref:S-layer homology domain-containing protein n=1 Tax=Bifidobacterium boum TaxID=78343 RepID=UPI001F409714|nr:S-layer homology domain-containing protein [Bifidobacterium boum]MCF2562345.1 S-layer homology domain-containing protein [Bifidobacterium boum]